MNKPLTSLSVEYVEAMSAAVAGVSVVTTNGAAGRFGLTVSSVTSVSAEPPILLVCIKRSNAIAAAITNNGYFTINLLSDRQQPLARIFSGKPEQGPAFDFSAASWHQGLHAAVLLDGAAANFECRLDSWHDSGSHRIFIGRVLAAKLSGLNTLVYHRRSYGRFAKF